MSKQGDAPGRVGNGYPRDKDGAGLDVQIHEEEYDAALAIVLDAINDDSGAHIDQLDKGALALGAALILNALIDLFVVSDALAKVLDGRLGVRVGIVGAAELDLANVGQDHLFIVADGLYKEGLISAG